MRAKKHGILVFRIKIRAFSRVLVEMSIYVRDTSNPDAQSHTPSLISGDREKRAYVTEM